MFSKKPLLLIPLMGIVMFSQAQNTVNAHMLWEITSDTGEKGYIAGAIPMADSDTYPLDTIYKGKFDRAEVLGVVTDFDSLQARTQLLFREKGFYKPEEHLKNHLTDKTYKQLSHRLNELGMPLGHNPRMKPWLLVITLQNLEINEAGLARQGIDEYLYNKAKEDKKEIVTLKPPEQPFATLAALRGKKQLDYLEYRLKNSPNNVDRLVDLMRYWKKGETDKIEPLLGRPLKSFSKELYHQLVYAAHKSWVVQIKGLIAQRDSPLIVVNLKHLTGPEGLLFLLKKGGVKVKQL